MQEIFIHFAKLDFIELIQGGKKRSTFLAVLL